jgi:hypothetical protein
MFQYLNEFKVVRIARHGRTSASVDSAMPKLPASVRGTID